MLRRAQGVTATGGHGHASTAAADRHRELSPFTPHTEPSPNHAQHTESVLFTRVLSDGSALASSSRASSFIDTQRTHTCSPVQPTFGRAGRGPLKKSAARTTAAGAACLLHAGRQRGRVVRCTHRGDAVLRVHWRAQHAAQPLQQGVRRGGGRGCKLRGRPVVAQRRFHLGTEGRLLLRGC